MRRSAEKLTWVSFDELIIRSYYTGTGRVINVSSKAHERYDFFVKSLFTKQNSQHFIRKRISKKIRKLKSLRF